MAEITEKELQKRIEDCLWLSENSGNTIPGICVGMCLPCGRVIESGKCPLIKELLAKEVDKNV